MDIYEMTLKTTTGKSVYKLILYPKKDPALTKHANYLRLVAEDFPITPDVARSMKIVGMNLFCGVLRTDIRCKDAAKRVYGRPATGATPVTPFFSEYLKAEKFMVDTYGGDWLKKYSLIYIEIPSP